MARKRFNAAEKEILAKGAGTSVEWQNVTQWHPGTLVSGEIKTEPGGWQYADVRNDDSKGHMFKGDVIGASPGHIRLPDGE